MDTKKFQNIIFFSFLTLVTLLFLYLLKPFFTPIFWAAVTASIFKPLYQRIRLKLKRPNLCASLMLLLIILIIILPAAVIGSLLVSESIQIYNSIGTDTSAIEKKVQHVIGLFADNPYMKRFPVDQSFIIEKFSEGVKSIANYLFVHLTDLTQNTIVFLVQFGVMIYTLFFFFRDTDRILGSIVRMSPLGEDRTKILYEQFTTTARATLKATIILGGLQGISGGLVFFLTGIEGAMVWGLLMMVLAILPGIGCSIIWAPAGLIMLLNNHFWEGVAILSFGVLVISLADNLLRPVLIGSDVEMHPLLIFLSTLGGLVVFGLSGFVIGPIITALFLAIWKMYETLYDDSRFPAGNSLQ
jgi:predicted PurR-regulated permease PerM